MTVPFFPSQRCPLCGEPAAWRYRDPICESCKGAEMPTPKPTKPMTDAEYAGWREALTRLDDAVNLTEQAKRSAPASDRAFVAGKLAGYTKGRDAVLAVVRREQERRRTAPDAPQSPTANERAENDLDHLNGHDAPTQGKSEGAAA